MAAVAVVVVAAAAVVVWPRGTTEVSQQDALERFREADRSVAGRDRRSEDAADHADDDGGARRVPRPGVYSYSATGQEEVKLGPLPAQTRPLPATVTAVVVDDGDCFTWTVNLFAEHTEDTRYCVEAGDLRVDGHTKHQRIGALSPTASMTCDPSVVRADEAEPLGLRCTLQLSGGPASITATLTGSATPREAVTMEVGDDRVEASPVTVAYEVAGDLAGTWTETTWWSASNLPVRVERSLRLEAWRRSPRTRRSSSPSSNRRPDAHSAASSTTGRWNSTWKVASSPGSTWWRRSGGMTIVSPARRDDRRPSSSQTKSSDPATTRSRPHTPGAM